MQYCFKCKNVCEDKLTVCPSCRRGRSLRQAKDDDMVLFLTTSQFEALELEKALLEKCVVCEIRQYKPSAISSVYDSSYMPSDKQVFVRYADLDMANNVLAQESKEEAEEVFHQELSYKMVLRQVLTVGAFFAAIALFIIIITTIFNSGV